MESAVTSPVERGTRCRPCHNRQRRHRIASKETAAISAVSVQVLEPGNRLIAEAWPRLERAGLAGPFGLWAWFDELRQSNAAGDLFALAAIKDGAVVGLLPLERRREKLGTLTLRIPGGDWLGTDHMDIVARPDDADEVARAIAQALAREVQWDVLDLDALSPTASLARALEGGPGMPRTLRRRVVASPCPVVDLRPEPGTSVIRSSGLRQQVRRGLRMAERTGGGFRVVREPAEVQRLLVELMRMHNARFGAASKVFATAERRAFHLAVGGRLAIDGAARIYALEQSGRDAALLYALLHDQRLFYYALGFDPEAEGSPGRTLLGLTAVDAAEEDLREFDLLRGDHGFKTRLATGARGDVRVTLWRSTPRAAALLARGAGRAAARRLVSAARATHDGGRDHTPPLTDVADPRGSDARPTSPPERGRTGQAMAASFATTVDYADHAEFERRARRITDPSYGDGGVLIQLRALKDILGAATRHRLLLLDSSAGSLHPDVAAAALLGLLPARYRPRIVLMGCMWSRSRGIRGSVEALLVRLADRSIVRYALQTDDEMISFPATWGLDPAKMRFCPYFATMDATSLDHAVAGTHVFAGGNSHRDYRPLIDAARHFPDTHFVLATDRLADVRLPHNVEAGLVTHARFVEMMRSAHIVVVALRPGLVRGAGQQTYLNAMAMGKAVVVADAAGVRGYIDDGRTGVICDGSRDGYVAALTGLLGPDGAPRAAALGAAAREAVRTRFTYHAHVDRLLAILDD